MIVNFDCQHHYSSGFHLELAFCAKGECTVLMGPSGSGKTSILSMIAGVVEPDQGSISIGDQLVFDSVKRINVPAEDRGVGYVFQKPNLFPHMTVLENLNFGTRWRRGSGPSIDQERLIDVLEIGHLLHRGSNQLSGGEQQRVAMGRALASRPRLLLMDEPVAHIDPKLRLKLIGFLKELLESSGIPLIYVTHAADEAERLGGDVFEINRGRLKLNQPDAL